MKYLLIAFFILILNSCVATFNADGSRTYGFDKEIAAEAIRIYAEK